MQIELSHILYRFSELIQHLFIFLCFVLIFIMFKPQNIQKFQSNQNFYIFLQKQIFFKKIPKKFEFSKNLFFQNFNLLYEKYQEFKHNAMHHSCIYFVYTKCGWKCCENLVLVIYNIFNNALIINSYKLFFILNFYKYSFHLTSNRVRRI